MSERARPKLTALVGRGSTRITIDVTPNVVEALDSLIGRVAMAQARREAAGAAGDEQASLDAAEHREGVRALTELRASILTALSHPADRRSAA